MNGRSESIDKLKEEVAAIKWFHSIDLGHGIVTPGLADSASLLDRLQLPTNMHGCSVLDIGALDGLLSFEAERRGASRVVALDSFCWTGDGPWKKDGFDLAKRVLNSKVEEAQMEVLDICPARLGVFDTVIFSGVLYHMRHPLQAIECVASVTGRQLILETHFDMRWCGRPVMVFYPGSELNNDPTNWWGPNPAAVIAMLKTVGLSRIEVIWKSPIRRRIAGAVKSRFIIPKKGRLAGGVEKARRAPFFHSLRQGRIVLHAWR